MSASPPASPIDALSVALSVVGFGGLVYGLSAIGAGGAGAMLPTWVPFVVGGLGIAAFVARQLVLQRTDRALLDLRTFRSRTFTTASLIMMLMMATLLGSLTLLPIYMQEVLHLSPLATGLLLLPGGLTMGLLGPVVGRLYDRVGARALLVPGTVVTSLALWWSTLFDATSPAWFVLGFHVLLSVGLAFVFTPLFTAGLGRRRAAAVLLRQRDLRHHPAARGCGGRRAAGQRAERRRGRAHRRGRHARSSPPRAGCTRRSSWPRCSPCSRSPRRSGCAHPARRRSRSPTSGRHGAGWARDVDGRAPACAGPAPGRPATRGGAAAGAGTGVPRRRTRGRGLETAGGRVALGLGRAVHQGAGPSGLAGHDDPRRVRRATGASPLERYVVTEELLAAGAPVAAHWVADRQIGPTLMRFGTEEQRRRYLPGIAAGEVYFGIGMSEPDSGSDLASVRTKAERVDGGWALTGTKVWTSGAHRARAFFALARTAPRDEAHRHAGLSQFIVELSSPGVTIRPIPLLTGAHHFNEVVFDGVFVPDTMVLGEIGSGWHQVTSELAFERSGPERFLSTYPLLAALVGELGGADRGARREVGALVTRLWTLRRMSLAIAGALASGAAPELAAAVVKDLGTRYENEIIDAARLLVAIPPDPGAEGGFARLLADAVLHAPGFTLRGGTNEVLRGIVARGLGLR